MTKKIKAVLAGFLGVAIAGGAAFAISAQTGRENDKKDEKTVYGSSVQVADDKNEQEEAGEAKENFDENESAEANEQGEQNEADEAVENSAETENKAETAESANLEKSARITPEQAKSAALAQVAGTVRKVELENEDGNVVYGVAIKTANGGERDVKVDAGNGQVLHTESGEENDGENDGEND